MRQDLLARLKFPPRQFRRLILFALLMPTFWFSWGVRTQGCHSDSPVALLPPVRTASFADASMIGVAVLAVVWLLSPIGIVRVAGHGKRAFLNLLGALTACLLGLFALFAVFAETLFGKLLAMSLAGALGMTCLGVLVLEAWSWVVTDIVGALRRRRAPPSTPAAEEGPPSEVVVADGVAGEERGLPSSGDPIEDEAPRV